MNNDQLINKSFHSLQRKKILLDKEKFIYNEIATRINDSLENINIQLNQCLEIGLTSQNTYNYILNRSKNIKYNALDISSDLLNSLPNSITTHCMDHDKWINSKLNFNLIISNFYLHLTNNFDILMGNIFLSLKKNGFLIAAVPGMNCFQELKNTFISTDIKLYGGAYRRFGEFISAQNIITLLKKHNFKTPVIDVDSLNLQYDDFYKLLKDVRYLGLSNILNDRKKNFENKKYFKKAEEIYWKKFSNNNKLILTLEIIFLSGWKN